MANKRFFWLKFNKDFFKDHKIKIIEAYPNGEKYLLFYIKLMAESVSHEGRLRFSDAIPYNERMIAAVTDTDIDVVHSALEILRTLGLVEIWDDETLYLTQVANIIGSETEVAERMRRIRAERKAEIEDKTQETAQCAEMCAQSAQRLENRDTLSKNHYIRLSIAGAGARVEDGVENVENPDANRPIYQHLVSFIQDNGLRVDPRAFRDYYDLKGWPEDWQAKVLTWHSYYSRSAAGQAEIREDKRTLKEYLDEVAAKVGAADGEEQ